VAQPAVPAPRQAPEPLLRRAPLQLPWSRPRACRPVIGDALLLQYPEVAKALAECSRSEETVPCLEAQGQQYAHLAAVAGGGT
jgi:hypothetical protein